VLRSRGLRVSLSGAIVFLVSLLSLIVLPNQVPIFGMLVGGVAVWLGFIVTIFSYYQNAPRQPPEG
jgi:hypothetical protein